MKIAYVTDQVLPRTATDTRQMVSMASAMGAAGAEITIVVPRKWFGGEPNKDAIAAFFEVAPAFSVQSVRSVYPSIRGVEKLAHALAALCANASRDAEVIYTRTLPILIASLLWGRASVAYETYRPWPMQRRYSRPFFRWVGRHPRFLGAVLHSDLARRSYVDAGVAAEKLVTVYNAYDATFLEPFLSRDDARTACGLDTCRSIVTYAGRVSKEKGVDLILDLARAMPRVMFVLVGSEGHGFIERRAETIENVTIVPWGADRKIAPYLHAADVLIMPPTARPLRRVGNTVLPIKTFQYLAAGRAILAPATPDVAEILIDGRNACLVPPDDVKAAKTRLEALLADEPARSSLAREAAATARRHTWPQRAGDVLEFLTERLDRSE